MTAEEKFAAERERLAKRSKKVDEEHEHDVRRMHEAHCALNIVRSLYVYGLRDDFVKWLEQKFVNNDSLTIEHGVLMACGAIDWLLGDSK